MALKLRISLPNNEFISVSSSTEELLKTLLAVQNRVIILTQEEEDSLRGWLLLRAEELSSGKLEALKDQPNICIGKAADGHPFVRSAWGDWPPLKPEFE